MLLMRILPGIEETQISIVLIGAGGIESAAVTGYPVAPGFTVIDSQTGSHLHGDISERHNLPILLSSVFGIHCADLFAVSHLEISGEGYFPVNGQPLLIVQLSGNMLPYSGAVQQIITDLAFSSGNGHHTVGQFNFGLRIIPCDHLHAVAVFGKQHKGIVICGDIILSPRLGKNDGAFADKIRSHNSVDFADVDSHHIAIGNDQCQSVGISALSGDNSFGLKCGFRSSSGNNRRFDCGRQSRAGQNSDTEQKLLHFHSTTCSS